MKRPQKSKKRVCNKQREWWEREEEDEREFPKWMTHYCSDHQILLVGDGDFSFSLSLAKAFASADNVVATSLDTYDEVINKYKNAKSNLEELQKLGAYLLHGVDATQMKFHPDLKMRRMHMDLVFGFFKNASHMLRINGEVHVNHKTTPPFDTWNIVKLAEQSFLVMIECADFKQEDYPGYNNKRGHRSRCDDPFPLGKCSTFKFINNPRSVKDHLRRNLMEFSRQQEIQNMERFPAPVYLNYHPRTRLPFEVIHHMERIPAPVDSNYHPRTRLPFEVIPNMERIPAPVDRNYHPQTVLVQKPNQLDYYTQTSIFPKTDQIDHYSQTNLFPKRNKPMRLEYDLRNGYLTITNNMKEIHGRVASSADYYCYARNTTHDTQRLLQPSTESSYNQFSQPSMPLGARNDGYHQYQQVLERSSTYLEEELNRNAQRSSDCFDIARHNLERYNAEVSRRDFRRREINVMQ